MKSLARSVGSYPYVKAGPLFQVYNPIKNNHGYAFLSPRFVLWVSEGLKSPGCHRCLYQPAGGSGTDFTGR